MADEKDQLIDELYSEVERLQDKNEDIVKSSSAAYGFNSGKDANLIALQLETHELLQKLERFYRGDILKMTGDDVKWEEQKDKGLIPLNDFGVGLLMEVITKYIDKNTLLSNYSEERIYEILGDLGDELILVIYCNYEKMGMDTAFKKSKFRILVITTLHVIEAAYRRSIEGKTAEKVNESRIVTQSDRIGRPELVMGQKKRSSLDPRSWGL